MNKSDNCHIYSATGYSEEFGEHFRVPVMAETPEEAQTLAKEYGDKIGFDATWEISMDISGHFDRDYIVEDSKYAEDGIRRLLSSDKEPEVSDPFEPYVSSNEAER